ncbi:MAG: 6-pyruvoyl-tetrahydropterin synthase-related protein [Candidatus Bathyarchaeota archaeon]|nr:6-pyruvoyl-tetrahydropterin synthase-related protein [Candidatus Bathyarchaeum sp.]
MKKTVYQNILSWGVPVLFSIMLGIIMFSDSSRFGYGMDTIVHLSKTNFLVDNFPYISQWNPLWYFGSPHFRFYSPLTYYIFGGLTWTFNLPLLDGLKCYVILINTIAALSIYGLVKELGIGRRMCWTASVVLTLTSYNVYHWWENIGALPYMTSMLLTYLALYAFLRAVRKQTISSIVFAAVSICGVLLTHMLPGFMLVIMLLCMSVVLIYQKPDLLLVPRDPGQPPRYTFKLPKVLIASGLLGVILSLWWWLPFISEGGLSYYLGTGATGAGLETAHAMHPLDFFFPYSYYGDLFYFGVGQSILAFCGLALMLKRKKKPHLLCLILFFLSLLGCFSSRLYLPLGDPTRWSIHLTTFSAILGAHFLELMGQFYVKNLKQKKVTSLILCGLVLLVCVSPSLLHFNQVESNHATLNQIDQPSYIDYLETNIKPGERVATTGASEFDLFSTIPQSMGGDIFFIYIWDNFAYDFWYYTFNLDYYNSSYYIPYYSRNYNVRYFLNYPSSSLTSVTEHLYEVQNFNSSLVEVVSSETIKTLVIGDENDYRRLFSAITPANPQEVVLINGGEYIETFGSAELTTFDSIYLCDFNFDDQNTASELLSSYVENGGNLIFDTSNVGEMTDIPDIFPVSQTDVASSTLNLTVIESSDLTDGIDFTEFTHEPYKISYAPLEYVKSGATVLVTEDGKPAMVHWKQGEGNVIWTGLGLPYHALVYRNFEESEFLTNIIRCNFNLNLYSSFASVTFQTPNADTVITQVSNASLGDAIWLKMSNYPGWKASVDNKNLKIFSAGPNMILVFPEKEGNYTVTFTFGKTTTTQIGEYITIGGIALIIVLLFVEHYNKRLRRKTQMGQNRT